MDQTLTFCGSCGAQASSPGSFCAQCGAALTATPVAHPDKHRPAAHRRNLLIASGAVGVVLALGGVATWAMAESASEAQLTRSADDLGAALVAMAAAEDTADVRHAAASAAAGSATAAAFVGSLPVDERHPGLSQVAEALGAIASLAEVSGEDPDPWEEAEEHIRSLADSDDATVAEVGALGDAAADRVDTVLERATLAYDEWAEANAAAVAERDAAISGATSYSDQMDGYLADYAELRNELSAYIDVVDTQGSTVAEAYRQLAWASQARRDLRDRMSSLVPPAQVQGEHGRLLSIIDDGIAGVEAAERGMDERECGFYGCTVSEQPSWQHFLSESKRISASLGAASDAWRAAAQSAVEDARAIALPEQPVL